MMLLLEHVAVNMPYQQTGYASSEEKHKFYFLMSIFHVSFEKKIVHLKLLFCLQVMLNAAFVSALQESTGSMSRYLLPAIAPLHEKIFGD